MKNKELNPKYKYLNILLLAGAIVGGSIGGILGGALGAGLVYVCINLYVRLSGDSLYQ